MSVTLGIYHLVALAVLAVCMLLWVSRITYWRARYRRGFRRAADTLYAVTTERNHLKIKVVGLERELMRQRKLRHE